jgi:hypothetical protein
MGVHYAGPAFFFEATYVFLGNCLAKTAAILPFGAGEPVLDVRSSLVMVGHIRTYLERVDVRVHKVPDVPDFLVADISPE